MTPKAIMSLDFLRDFATTGNRRLLIMTFLFFFYLILKFPVP